jgi:hypothetical protein
MTSSSLILKPHWHLTGKLMAITILLPNPRLNHIGRKVTKDCPDIAGNRKIAVMSAQRGWESFAPVEDQRRCNSALDEAEAEQLNPSVE